MLEERDLVAKATPGYGKTLTLCLVAVLRSFQMKASCATERRVILLVHPSTDGVEGIYELCRTLARALYKGANNDHLFPKLAITMRDVDESDIFVAKPEEAATFPKQLLERVYLLGIDSCESLR